jgi:Pyridoxal-dependent decarboxylase, pyridoxal binding domain
MIVRPLERIADHSVDVGARLVTDVRLDEAIALRRCALYRTAFRGAAIGYPADAIRHEAIAGWMRRQGVTVDVAGLDELDWAVVAGIRPSHIVMHRFNEASGPIVLDYGVGRVIVESAEQVAMLCASTARPQGILLDVTDACLDDPATVDRRLWLDGLHYRADGADLADLSEILFGMIAEMALMSRKRAAVLSRLSVGDVDLTDCDGDPRSLRRVAQTIDEVVEEACVRFRYPRPALTVSPRPATLLPAA